eukprot:scaffold912_cov187-Ochromonas_danica.AAC.25
MHCSTVNFLDNIGNVRSEVYRAYGSIDVVYTWVNGSDPRWLAKKNYWAEKYSSRFPPSPPLNMSAANNTNNTNNSTDSSNNNTHDEDEVMSDNRYRDSEELRYSLRSIVKYAPWVRHIYLVTDNQLPYWLNLETGKLTVVSHETIFRNTSHLPVFSSPAIEANLHNIPGLSDYFIYFNDDVFLGAPALPEDFISLSGLQRFIMAWEVPKCAPGCSDTWIGDGYCDKACNVSECNWDYPDCINGSNVMSSSYGSSSSSGSHHMQTIVQCSSGCPDSWLADKICDQRCNNYECGFDMGDCSIHLIKDGYPSLALSKQNTFLSAENHVESESSFGYDYSEYYPWHEVPDEGHEWFSSLPQDRQEEHRLSHLHHHSSTNKAVKDATLTVPYGTRLAYFDLGYLEEVFRLLGNINSNLSQSNVSATETVEREVKLKFVNVEHDDITNEVVHVATLLLRHRLLVVLLHTDDEHYQSLQQKQDIHRLSPFPFAVSFTITVNDELSPNPPLMLSCRLMVSQREQYLMSSELSSSLDSTALYVAGRRSAYSLGMREVSQGHYRYPEELEIDILPLPLRIESLPSTLDESNKTIVNSPHSSDTVLVMTLQNNLSASFEVLGIRNCDEIFVKTVLSFYTDLPSKLEGQEIEKVNSNSTANSFRRLLPLCSLLLNYEVDKQVFYPLPAVDSVNDSLTSSWQHSKVGYDAFLFSSAATHLLQRNGLYKMRKEINNNPRVLLGLPSLIPSIQNNRSEGYFHFHVQIVQGKMSECELLQSEVENNDDGCNGHPLAFFSGLVRLKNSILLMPSVSTATQREELEGVGEIMRDSAIPVDSVDSNISAVNTTKEIVTNSSETTPVALDNLPAEVESVLKNTSEPQHENIDQDARRLASSSSHANFIEDVWKAMIHGLEAFDLAHSSFSFLSPWHVSKRQGKQATRRSSNRLYLQNLFSAFHLESLEEDEVNIARRSNSRRRLDTYAQSLIHVNRLYNKEFGLENRKVPAHVPHFIAKRYAEEMQSFYPAQWDHTSSNRFRSGDDMQYAFSYYYWVINRHKKVRYDLLYYLQTYVDSDGDGHINNNEMRTLANIYFQHSASNEEMENLFSMLNNCTANNANETGLLHHHSLRYSTPLGEVQKTYSIRLHPRLDEVVGCNELKEGLYSAIQWQQVYGNPMILSDRDYVAFEMINDNYSTTVQQLDSIRARQSKFICVNDNMKHPSEELMGELRAFFLSFFPQPSIFELPKENSNPTLYLDEYLALKKKREEDYVSTWMERFEQTAYKWTHSFRMEVVKILRDYTFRLYASFSELSPSDGQERYSSVEERRRKQHLDELTVGLHHRPSLPSESSATRPRAFIPEIGFNRGNIDKLSGPENSSLHLALFCGVIGIVLTYLMRRMLRRRVEATTITTAVSDSVVLPSTSEETSKEKGPSNTLSQSNGPEKKKRK